MLVDPIDGLDHFMLASKQREKIELKNELFGQTIVFRQLGQANGNKLWTKGGQSVCLQWYLKQILIQSLAAHNEYENKKIRKKKR